MNVISERRHSREAIERHLDRAWMDGRIPVNVLRDHRAALTRLDEWLQRDAGTTLATASAAAVRMLLDSTKWQDVSRDCESLLGLVAGFYHGLQESKFRPDDPIETLIDQELYAVAIKLNAEQLRHDVRRTSAA